MEYSTHGGLCCGYGHIYGFDRASIADFNECLEEHARAGRGGNRICEVILSQRQIEGDALTRREVLEAGGWPAVLAGRGFRLAAQWTNSNTNRRCYQFLLIPELLTDDENYRPPFAWDGQVVGIRRGVPAPAANPPVGAVVFIRPAASEFYAHLRQGGRRGPFGTVEAAREAYPRCQRFEERIIMNNGESRWGFV